MSLIDLKDRVAIITGGGTGIGKAIALEFARAGANIVVASRKVENLDKTVAEVTALGCQALAVATDVRVPDQVNNMVKQTLDRFGKIDILVNNAGASFPVKAVDISPNGWNAVIGINLNGVFFCSQAVARVMIPQKQGKIVNISSMAGIGGDPGMAHYAAAKAGVVILTKTLAVEWAPYNINVNCIAPGLVDTEGVKAQAIFAAESAHDKPTEVPLLLPGKPEDIAHVALFLASDLSSRMSGEILPVKGVRKD